MKTGQTDLHEVKVLDDGMIRARRHDRQPMTTDQDWVAVQRWVEANRSVTVADALRIVGGRVLSPEEAREIMAEDADLAAILAERDHWYLDGNIWSVRSGAAMTENIRAALVPSPGRLNGNQ